MFTISYMEKVRDICPLSSKMCTKMEAQLMGEEFCQEENVSWTTKNAKKILLRQYFIKSIESYVRPI